MRLLPAIIFICSAQLACAQATLTGANFNAIPGDIFTTHICSRPYQLQGSGGANVIWDFSNIITTGQTSTFTYVACASAPACDTFPGSNLAAEPMPATGYYSYYTANDNYFSNNGSYGNGDFSIATNGLKMTYPFTYGTTYSGYDSTFEGGIYYQDTFSMLGDGYGKLILPAVTYDNTIRVRRIDSVRYVGFGLILSGQDTISFHTIVTHTVDTSYTWLTPDFHISLLTVSYYYNFDTLGLLFSKDTFVSYNAVGPAAVVPIAKQTTTLELYPNPTTDILNIKFTFTETGPVSITLLDLLGKEIATINDNTFEPGEHNLTYNTCSLPKGLYLLQLKSNTGIETQKIVVH